MSFRADLTERLKTDTTISGLISDRVYGIVRAPNAEGDSITVRRVSSEPGHDLNSGSGVETGRFELWCLSTDILTVDQIAEAVRQRMQGESGTWGSSKIFSVVFEDEADDYVPPGDGETVGSYIVVLIYRIQRELSVPS